MQQGGSKEWESDAQLDARFRSAVLNLGVLSLTWQWSLSCSALQFYNTVVHSVLQSFYLFKQQGSVWPGGAPQLSLWLALSNMPITSLLGPCRQAILNSISQAMSMHTIHNPYVCISRNQLSYLVLEKNDFFFCLFNTFVSEAQS